MKKEYEIKLTPQEIFEVLEILKLYVEVDNGGKNYIDDDDNKELRSAYDKLNIEIKYFGRSDFWSPRFFYFFLGGPRPHALLRTAAASELPSWIFYFSKTCSLKSTSTLRTRSPQPSISPM